MTEEELAGYMLSVEGSAARLKAVGSETKPDGDGRVRQWVTMTITENGGDQEITMRIEASAVLMLARLAVQELASARTAGAATATGDALREVSSSLQRGAASVIDMFNKAFEEAGKRPSGGKDKFKK